MSWIVPLRFIDDKLPVGSSGRDTHRYLHQRIPLETSEKPAYTTTIWYSKALRFSSKEEAEAAQARAIELYTSLPQPPEWAEEFAWPVIAAMPVEKI